MKYESIQLQSLANHSEDRALASNKRQFQGGQREQSYAPDGYESSEVNWNTLEHMDPRSQRLKGLNGSAIISLFMGLYSFHSLMGPGCS